MSAPKADNLPLPRRPSIRFKVASIDCPWHFETRSKPKQALHDRSPQRHYPTMDLDHISRIPMLDILDDDAWVFAWFTGPLLVRGVHSMLARAWGLEVSSMAFVWVKLWNGFDTGLFTRTPLLEADIAFGGGYTTRQNAEFVVLMRRGAPKRLRKDIRQIIISPRREHSRKPTEFYRRVEHFCAGPRIDMFAGADRDGWTRWGWGHRDGEGERCDMGGATCTTTAS